MNAQVWQALWDSSEKELFLWAEATPHPLEQSPSDGLHPFCIDPESINLLLAEREIEARKGTAHVYLPTVDGLPLSSPRLHESPPEHLPAIRMQSWECTGLRLAPIDALNFLSVLPSDLELLDDSVLFWREATKLLLELLSRGRYLPGVHRKPDSFQAHWFPVVREGDDLHRFQVLAQHMPPIARGLREVSRTSQLSGREVLDSFLATGTNELVRVFLARSSLHSAEESKPNVSRQWLAALTVADGEVNGPVYELIRLEERLRHWARPFMHTAQPQDVKTVFQIVPPGTPEHEIWRIEFLLSSNPEHRSAVPAEQLWRGEAGKLQAGEHSLEEIENQFLKDLGRTVDVFPEIRRALTDPYPTHVELSTAEAYQFLREAAPELEALGFPVLTPSWWQKPTAQFGLKLGIDSGDFDAVRQSRLPLLGTGQLLDFSWTIALGDQELTLEEFEKLVKRQTPLIRLQGQWVELDPRKAEATLEFLRQQQVRRRLTFLEALHFGFGIQETSDILPMQGMSTRGWIRRLLQAEDQEIEMLKEPESFKGELRPYQREGLSWLIFRLGLGIGACLADDMGLGKTVQLLALLLHEREQLDADIAKNPDMAEEIRSRPLLLIVPMSILANWEHELARFAPSLTFYVHHGTQRWTQDSFLSQVKNLDVVVTTYSLAFRDEEMMSAVEWKGMVLDEAQNIKNVDAKQTRSIRRLCQQQLTLAQGRRPFYRLALTGTPLENHLQELWSIFDFLNPGFFGTLQDFRTRYALPIERLHSRKTAEALSSLLRPFVLRRLKSDPKVISDLPEKIEMQELISLTHEQAALYQSALEEMMPQVEAARGIHRKGLVLATITKLKQICNHPTLALKDGSELAGRSHKISRLEELLEEILAEGDKTLIFTQFAQFGHLLQPYLQKRLNTEVLFLHGALPRQAREKLVSRFQEDSGPSIFILSLKAGGFGLNLTQANQVIHVDQWWNPAVEDQATDRVYRIGQLRNVQVRKLICKGTLEERIAEMLQRKRELADEIVGSTKDSITQLSTDELRRLLELAPTSRLQDEED